jgi:putative transposase
MARKPRSDVAGVAHHVFARGNAKDVVFHDAIDRRVYLKRLGVIVHGFRWQCLAFCLLENHVHLLIESPEAGLSRGMHDLHGAYAQYFNKRHDRVGHVFQGRFGAVPVVSDGQMQAVARYIARNPVAAGLVEEPRDWPWSSYASAVGNGAPGWLAFERLFSYFDPDPRRGRRRYMSFCERPST